MKVRREKEEMDKARKMGNKKKKRNGEDERAGTENEWGREIRKGTIEGPRKRKKERKKSNTKINNECEEVDNINNKNWAKHEH